nr:hypothetical protein CFP56_09686 [Quercus suber]
MDNDDKALRALAGTDYLDPTVSNVGSALSYFAVLMLRIKYCRTLLTREDDRRAIAFETSVRHLSTVR